MKMKTLKVYQLLEPGPVVLLTTARRGRANVMTMSWQRYPSSLPIRARTRLGRHDAARPARSAWSVQRQLAARFDGEVAGGAVAISF
jgi:hypothetical protein